MERFFSFMRIKKVNELQAITPFFVAAVVAGLVAFLRGTLANQPPTVLLRLCESALCGLGALTVSVLAGNHYPSYTVGDSLAIAFGIGYIGAGKVSDLALIIARKKLNLGGDDK